MLTFSGQGMQYLQPVQGTLMRFFILGLDLCEKAVSSFESELG